MSSAEFATHISNINSGDHDTINVATQFLETAFTTNPKVYFSILLNIAKGKTNNLH